MFSVFCRRKRLRPAKDASLPPVENREKMPCAKNLAQGIGRTFRI